MVILLKQHAPQAEQERLLAWLRELGAEVRVTGTPERPFFCLTGDISRIDPSLAARFPAVEDVLRLTEPYPLCSRRLHPGPTVVSVGETRFGGGHFGLIAGPCAVESEEQIFTAARQAKAAGVSLLRGGAFKPRTSPSAPAHRRRARDGASRRVRADEHRPARRIRRCGRHPDRRAQYAEF